MNEEMQSKVYEWVGNKIQSIEQWTSEEIPLVIHEFLKWKYFENVFDISLSIIIILIFASLPIIFYNIWSKKLWSKSYDNRTENEDFIAFFPFWTGVLVFFIIFVTNLPVQEVKNCIQIKTAPRVYLIEEFQKAIKD